MTGIESLHHVSVIVADTSTALAFYVDVLGMEPDPTRPDLGYPGAWLKVGGQQLHLLELPNPDSCSGRPAHAGRDRHCAFRVSNLNALIEKLDSLGIPCSRSHSGRPAVFLRDPDGNGIELIGG